MNKYLYTDTSETELNIIISTYNGSEELWEKDSATSGKLSIAV